FDCGRGVGLRQRNDGLVAGLAGLRAQLRYRGASPQSHREVVEVLGNRAGLPDERGRNPERLEERSRRRTDLSGTELHADDSDAHRSAPRLGSIATIGSGEEADTEFVAGTQAESIGGVLRQHDLVGGLWVRRPARDESTAVD